MNEFLSMDDLAVMPSAKFRAGYTEHRHPKGLDFEKTIGKTTYVVTSRFNQSTSEDVFRKVIRLMESGGD